ncbi:hypothetical protein POPTR_012G015670v4 [Populus trichocarpa]|uniref:Uncharacterized protein n=3 Tax=Populus trichocarpa TaxID=3694 RepID=A0ACC0S4W0_POPTR|nr:hypothetical protein POPTR_012G013580v4 [Populus trichocarpa]KAI9384064.1 hypothetical protein POPTR_012G013580v4 [Populus trichocarpa]KAI9384066.1 hypothetical protein POPTR_012G015670v4 [Populus trichocarpa]
MEARNLSSSHMGNFLVHKKGYCYMDLQAPGRPCFTSAIAKESGVVCINVRISNLMSKWAMHKILAPQMTIRFKAIVVVRLAESSWHIN